MWSRIERTARALVVGLFVAAFASILLGLVVVLSQHDLREREPIARSVAEARLTEEEAVATALGFAREFTEDVHARGPIVRPFSLELGECVAALAGVHGTATRPVAIAIVPAGGSVTTSTHPSNALSAQPAVEGLVAHTEWCTDRPIDLEVVVQVRSTGGTPDVMLRLLRAPRSIGLTNESITRGWVLRDSAAVLGPLDAGGP